MRSEQRVIVPCFHTSVRFLKCEGLSMLNHQCCFISACNTKQKNEFALPLKLLLVLSDFVRRSQSFI